MLLGYAHTKRLKGPSHPGSAFKFAFAVDLEVGLRRVPASVSTFPISSPRSSNAARHRCALHFVTMLYSGQDARYRYYCARLASARDALCGDAAFWSFGVTLTGS